MSMEHIYFRPSMAPGAALCPSYMYRKKGPQVGQVPTIFSSLGTALHKVFELYTTKGNTPTDEDYQEVAHRYNVGMVGYYGLVWRAKRMAEHWEKVKGYFTEPISEAELHYRAANDYPIKGHPDLFQVFGSDYAVVLDLKMGEQEGIDYFVQGAWYAWLVYKIYHVQKVYVMIFAPMLDTYETREFTAKELDEMEEKFCESCLQSGHIYNGPNPMCRFCANVTDCYAICSAIDPIVKDLSVIQAKKRQITPADITRMRPFFQIMKKRCDAFDEAVKSLIESFGPIDLADGTWLHLVNDFTTKFKPEETYNHLVNCGIDSEKVLAEMSISKDGIKSAIKSIAVPRSATHGVAVLQKRILSELDEVGATESVPRRRMSVKNQPVITKAEEVE